MGPAAVGLGASEHALNPERKHARLRVGDSGPEGLGFLARRVASCALVGLLAVTLASYAVSSDAHAGGGVDAVMVQVTGAPLSNITSSPLDISPTFAQTTTDYVWRCESGINTIQLTLSAVSGGTITVGGRSGRSVAVQESMVENQALIVSAPDPNTASATPVNYWIRCLPQDFPQLSVTKPGTPPPGWYLTGNLSSVAGSGYYAMVLDANGTPVWYRRPVGQEAIDVTPLPDGAIAWWSNNSPGGWEDYNLNAQATRWLAGSVPIDPHELQPMSNGNLMVLSNPTTSNMDLSALGLSSSATIADCVLDEFDPYGRLVWTWRASDHIGVAESTHPYQVGQSSVYDPFHCNSVDADPVSGDLLLSMRHTDAVYRIDETTGAIAWKLGGNPIAASQTQILAVVGDPEGVFHAQHDARFQPNGDISLYDNQSWDPTLAARGVEYHIDTVAGTATLVWSYQSPDGHNSGATGSFRRLNGGTDNVIGWGFKRPQLFTEVDASGTVMMNVTFPNGEFAYRVQKVGLTALDHDLLRATAGLPPFSLMPDTDPVITANGPTLRATEGMGFNDTVATFSDPDPTATASEYLATIAWGDGSSSPGAITGPDGGPFTVSGTHTYAEEGTNVVTVYITDASDPTNTAIVTPTMNVGDAALSASCAMPANSLTSFSGRVASFTDADPSATPSDYTATITWGDGSSTPGTVTGPDGGPFTISGAHVYATTGKFNIITTVKDAGGAATSTTCGLLTYAFPSGTGAFAIGDRNSAKGTEVTFWGGRWSKLNSLSGGSAPDSFNGFGQTSSMPTCGAVWNTIAGNGNPPAGNQLPTYMGVIVTSSVTQSGSTDSGNAVHIVIVRTKPGYQSDSGHLGNGTVEAQVC